WEQLSRYRYTDWPMYKREETPVYPVITTRGCPFACLFCNEGDIWQRKVRFRSIELVLDEVAWLYQRYQARSFNILDDTFTLKADRMRAFCGGLRRRKLDIDWRCTAHTNTVTAEILGEMAAAGCKLVAYGVESGNETIL